jgi:uncharacterized membrane protein
MKSKYRLMAVIGIILVILGIVFVAILPWACPIEIAGGFGPPIPSPNTKFSFFGIAMIVIGAVLTFYGRYKYTKEEEKEDIEKAKRDQ